MSHSHAQLRDANEFANSDANTNGIALHFQDHLYDFLSHYADNQPELSPQDVQIFKTQITRPDSVRLSTEGFSVHTKSENNSIIVRDALAQLFTVKFDVQKHLSTVTSKLQEADDKLHEANMKAKGLNFKKKPTGATTTTTSSTTTVSLALTITNNTTTTTVETHTPAPTSTEKLSVLTKKAKKERKAAVEPKVVSQDVNPLANLSLEMKSKINEVMFKLNALKNIYLIVHPGDEKEIKHEKSGYSLPAKYHTGVSKFTGIALPSMFSLMGKAINGMRTLAIAFEKAPLIGRYSKSGEANLVAYILASNAEVFAIQDNSKFSEKRNAKTRDFDKKVQLASMQRALGIDEQKSEERPKKSAEVPTRLDNKLEMLNAAIFEIERSYDAITHIVAGIRQRKSIDDPIYGKIFEAFVPVVAQQKTAEAQSAPAVRRPQSK